MDFNRIVEEAVAERKKRLKLFDQKKELQVKIKELHDKLEIVNNTLYASEGLPPEWERKFFEYVEELVKEGK